MRYSYIIVLIVLSIFTNSCRKDFETVPSFGNLQFSKDTVFLDTIFSNIGSATYNLKVYNKSSNAITIPSIQLKNGINSNYRLNVDGIAGKIFQDIDILAKDSIYVFIETTVDVNTITNPLYTDQIVFDNGNNEQSVELITLIQDANFIFPSKNSLGIETLVLNGEKSTIQGRFLTDNELVFTDEKPYVIYGYAAVPEDKTLTINSGARIHFHNNSGLLVDKNASLKINGTLEEKVIFEGDRLENKFSDIPGQWGTIWLRAGSKENDINHALIKNGTIGILVDSINTSSSPVLTIKNSEIYNNTNYGILGRNTNIKGENLVIGNTGQSSLACTFGGTYNFTHATFANYWSNSFRQLPAVLINNHNTSINSNGDEIVTTNNLNAANFTNCIIDGANNIEFLLDRISGTTFNYSVENSMIKFNDVNNSFSDIDELDFNNTSNYKNIILNGEPNFKNPFENGFMIGNNSDVINKATSSSITTDILGVNRTMNPDIGAYQHTDF